MTTARFPRLFAAAAAAATLALAACGGDDGTAATEPTSAAPAPSTTMAPATTSTVAVTTAPVGDDAARNSVVLRDVCYDDVYGGRGYAGNATYDPAAPGPRPLALKEFHPVNRAYLETIRELPEWVIKDTEYDQDNPAAATVQLVGCLMEVARTPRGIDCEFPTNDGGSRTLALFDGTYELQMRSAQTREVVERASLVATSDGCPATVEFLFDETEYVNVLTDDQIVAALSPFAGV